ncbi:MAG: hypothetical protein JNK48_17135 [Bryobacterales bacterium]|nr:hypothetical protein [Bryobacterales bacterium]
MFALFSYFLYCILPLPLAAYPNRVPAGHAGVPGETNPPCTSCHTVTLNSASGSVALAFDGGNVYRPGQAQQVTVRITDADTSRVFGFQATVRTSANAQGGAFTAGTNTTVTTQGTLAYINQTRSAATYTFTWTPPATASGTLRFYVAGLAARGARDSRVYTATYDLTPEGTVPSLRTENPAVLAAGFRPVISSGAWMSLFGANLAPSTRTWDAATEIADGSLPRALDGVSVTVNGRAAAIHYISPTQLNVQAPDDDATGIVEVKVTTREGSATGTVERARYSPGLFALEESNVRYASAVLSDGTRAGSPSSLRPLRAGEVISLFGTGFGETEPAMAAGIVVTAPASLGDLSQLQVRVGGLEAKLLWAGLVSAGLFQINIEIPALAAGDHAVVAERSGVATQDNVYLSIAQ